MGIAHCNRHLMRSLLRELAESNVRDGEWGCCIYCNEDLPLPNDEEETEEETENVHSPMCFYVRVRKALGMIPAGDEDCAKRQIEKANRMAREKIEAEAALRRLALRMRYGPDYTEKELGGNDGEG